jgi:hypothetical protein
VDREDAQVTALKPPFQGEGVVVRLASFARGPIEVRLACRSRPIRMATLCDARERAISTLEVREGVAIVPLRYALGSVRVTF